jgi:hypothetical protein
MVYIHFFFISEIYFSDVTSTFCYTAEVLLELGLLRHSHAFFAETIYRASSSVRYPALGNTNKNPSKLTPSTSSPIAAAILLRAHVGLSVLLFLEGRDNEAIIHLKDAFVIPTNPSIYASIARYVLWLANTSFGTLAIDRVIPNSSVGTPYEVPIPLSFTSYLYSKKNSEDGGSINAVSGLPQEDRSTILSPLRGFVPAFLASLMITSASLPLESGNLCHEYNASQLRVYISCLNASYLITSLEFLRLGNKDTQSSYSEAVTLVKKGIDILKSQGDSLFLMNVLLFHAWLVLQKGRYSQINLFRGNTSNFIYRRTVYNKYTTSFYESVKEAMSIIEFASRICNDTVAWCADGEDASVLNDKLNKIEADLQREEENIAQELAEDRIAAKKRKERAKRQELIRLLEEKEKEEKENELALQQSITTTTSGTTDKSGKKKVSKKPDPKEKVVPDEKEKNAKKDKKIVSKDIKEEEENVEQNIVEDTTSSSVRSSFNFTGALTHRDSLIVLFKLALNPSRILLGLYNPLFFGLYGCIFFFF